jgi:hypothetical protein
VGELDREPIVDPGSHEETIAAEVVPDSAA